MSSGYSYTAGHGYVVREEAAGVWLVRDRTGRPVARAKTWRTAVWWAMDAPPVQDEPIAAEPDDLGHVPDGDGPGAAAWLAGLGSAGSSTGTGGTD